MSTVLIVEDDADLAGAIARGVQRRGHTPIVALTAADALRALADGRIGSAAVDLSLPDQPGTEVLGALRSAGVPALAISGIFRGAAAARRCVEEFGARAFLEKPFPFESAVDLLVRLASEPRAPPPAVATPPPPPVGEDAPWVEVPTEFAEMDDDGAKTQTGAPALIPPTGPGDFVEVGPEADTGKVDVPGAAPPSPTMDPAAAPEGTRVDAAISSYAGAAPTDTAAAPGESAPVRAAEVPWAAAARAPEDVAASALSTGGLGVDLRSLRAGLGAPGQTVPAGSSPAASDFADIPTDVPRQGASRSTPRDEGSTVEPPAPVFHAAGTGGPAAGPVAAGPSGGEQGSEVGDLQTVLGMNLESLRAEGAPAARRSGRFPSAVRHAAVPSSATASNASVGEAAAALAGETRIHHPADSKPAPLPVEVGPDEQPVVETRFLTVSTPRPPHERLALILTVLLLGGLIAVLAGIVMAPDPASAVGPPKPSAAAKATRELEPAPPEEGVDAPVDQDAPAEQDVVLVD